MPALIAGDTHGDSNYAYILAAKAQAAGVDVILQLGDFGFVWSPDLLKLDKLNTVMRDHNVELWFLDGNHENFDLLGELGAFPDGDEAVYIASNIRYLPRGYVFDLCGWKCMSFGGAFSIDVGYRTPHVSWWSDETISEGQVRKVEDNPTKVDILFSHDVPEVPQYLYDNLLHQSMLGYKLDSMSRYNREMLRRVFDVVKPERVFHGHYHCRYTDTLDGAVIEGLGMNGDTRNTYLLEDKDV